MTWLPDSMDYFVLALGSMLAAVVNTMAGGGSMLVVPLLLAVGLPPGVANGTLRVGILLQGVVSWGTFARAGTPVRPHVTRLLPPVLVGAALGTWGATRLGDVSLLRALGGAFVLWAVVLVFRPAWLLRPDAQRRESRLWTTWLGACAVGLYGGFLQAGVGLALLALLTLGVGLNAVTANAVKTALVALYTVLALMMFAYADLVSWPHGAALGLGGVLGGWAGARWQLRAGAGVVRWFVIAAAAGSGVTMVLTSVSHR